MSSSWILGALLIVVAILPFALLGVVRLVAWLAPASARTLAEIERRHHRAYWGVFALLYVVAGVGHLVGSRGEPVFGALFLLMAGAAIIKGARDAR